MTKSELIRKLAKNFGVPVTESKEFFELLLIRLAEKLHPDRSCKLDDFGYFHLIKSGTSDDRFLLKLKDNLKINLMAFSENKNLSEGLNDVMLFSIPGEAELAYNEVDSAFSLSIGKPLIPLDEKDTGDFLVASSGIELKRLIESKAEKVIDSIDDIFVRDHEPQTTTTSLTDETTTEDLSQQSFDEQEITQNDWDFGKELKREIEEESILDIDEKENVSWDFGIPPGSRFNPVEDETGEVEETRSSELTEEKIDDKFERVQPIALVPEDEIVEEQGEDDIDENEFEEIDSGSETLLDDYSTPEIEKRDTISLDEDGINEKFSVTSTIAEEREKFLQGRRKKSTVAPFLILFFSVVIVAAAFFYYVNNIKKDDPESEDLVSGFNTTKTKFIERDFEIPVNYPYEKGEVILESSLTSINSAILNNNIDITKDDTPEVTENVETQNNLPDETTTNIETSEPVVESTPLNNVTTKNYKRVRGNIFSDGNKYVVQVASFRSESIARNEAGKLRNKGMDAFVEEAEIPGRGTWHRVKVGFFNSLSEAEDFERKQN